MYKYFMDIFFYPSAVPDISAEQTFDTTLSRLSGQLIGYAVHNIWTIPTVSVVDPKLTHPPTPDPEQDPALTLISDPDSDPDCYEKYI